MERKSLVVSIPITRVTLLEDRAHVSRRATIAVEEGVTRLRVAAVSPVIADKSLVARGETDDVRVIDARVVRSAATTDVNEEAGSKLEKLKREDEALQEEISCATSERAADEEQLALLDELAGVTLDEIAIDVAWGRAPDAATDAKLDELAAERRRLRAELVRHARGIKRLHGLRRRLSQRIAELENPSSEIDASLVIDLQAGEAGSYGIEIDYVVPGACWRPHHTAELRPQDVRFTTDGCVWQNTGEDWENVELVFSTERASLGTEPPELASDVLRVQRRAAVLEVEARDAVVKEASLGGASSDELPGIDDGGEALALRALSRADVPSDGRPYRVALSTFSSPADIELVCQPELDAAVLLKSTQNNTSSSPVLAGPVDLIRDSGLCGKTSVLFIGPSERFELGWGPEPEVRVQRDLRVKGEEAGLLSSWVELRHKVEVRLSNLGAKSHRIVVRERVPVSEIDKVKIEPLPKKTTGNKHPDGDGFVDWDVTLSAHSTTDSVLQYDVKKHTDVVGL